jgi:hypothetical protein
VSGIARAEKLDRTYVGDVLPLTLLAPDLVEAIVEEGQGVGVTLPALMKSVPADWEMQSDALTRSGRAVSQPRWSTPSRRIS